MTLPADIRLGTVRLQVAHLDRSLGFYRDVIGFAEIGTGDGVARLGPGGGDDAGDPPVLLELVEKPGARPVPRTGLLGIYHFALLLPGRADLGRFVRRLARTGHPFGAADHAFSEALYLEDPDGITIEVYADRPREAWPVGGEGSGAGPRGAPPRGLPLVSDPLDAAGLMAAAGPAEWDGVPAGAIIGHMHFFVDDLTAANDFYIRGLGFEPMIAIPTALFVAAGGYHHHVGLNTWRAGARTADDGDARLLDWELVVPDAAARSALADRLEAAGFATDAAERGRESGRAAGDGRSGAIVARDPWGIEVRVTGR